MPLDPISQLLFSIFGAVAGKATAEGVHHLWKNRKNIRLFKRVARRKKYPVIFSGTGLVNCESEMRSLEAALLAEPQSRLLFFSGVGGIGKTRLLDEARRLVVERPLNKKLRWGGLLDLYHSDLHDVTHLQRAIIENLDPEGKHFQNARTALANFEQSQREGITGGALQRERETLSKHFLQDFHQYSRKYRPILAFDTAESLQHESELIQSLCGLDDLGERHPSVLRWLLHQAVRLDNTVILIAGRPRPQLQQRLEQQFGDPVDHFQAITLQKLTFEELRVLLDFLSKQMPEVKALSSKTRDDLFRFSEGLPVRLILGMELLVQSVANELLSNDAVPSDQWGHRLIGSFFAFESRTQRPFYYLALARKGLDADLLDYLEPDWPFDSCAEQLNQLWNSSLIKMRPGRDELFLHDELYALFDAYYPHEKPASVVYTRLREYWRFRRSQVSNQVDKIETQVNELYYDLCLHPQCAFASKYVRWAEDAVKAHNKELDMRLRDEVLRFLPSLINRQHGENERLHPNIVDRDSAVRWVKRFLADSEYERALTIAETVLSLGPDAYKQLALTGRLLPIPEEKRGPAQTVFAVEDSLFWGHLITYYAEGLAYVGVEAQRIQHLFEEAIRLLQAATNETGEASDWLRNRVIGRAHNTSGYTYRMAGRYRLAQTAFEQALVYFKRAGVADEEADTRNNLALVSSFLGDFDLAFQQVEQALEIRLAQGQRFPIALSYNTRGRLLALAGWPEQGQKDCENAMQIFQGLESSENPRGTGLTFNALAYVLRRLGQGWQQDEITSNQAQELYSRSEAYLIESEHIFSRLVEEPVRLWEAYNERGNLYYDWGLLERGRSENNSNKEVMYLQPSLKYHRLALDVAERHRMIFQAADTMDDIAKVYGVYGKLDEAKYWLYKVKQVVPAEYHITLNHVGDELPPSGEAYWHIMGKWHTLQAMWAWQEVAGHTPGDALQTTAIEEGTQLLALALVCFYRFSPHGPAWNAVLKPALHSLARADVNQTTIEAKILETLNHFSIVEEGFQQKIPDMLQGSRGSKTRGKSYV